MTASKNTHLFDSLLPWLGVCTTLKLPDVNEHIPIGHTLEECLGENACLYRIF